jgi:hypothetical protein
MLEEGHAEKMISSTLEEIFAALPSIIALSRKYQSQTALTYMSQIRDFSPELLMSLEGALNEVTDKNKYTGNSYMMFAAPQAAPEDPPSHLCCPITMVIKLF